MDRFDLGSLLWPDALNGRQPNVGASLRPRYSNATIFLGPDCVSDTRTLPQISPHSPSIYAGERVLNPTSSSANLVLLGSANGSHIILVRLRVVSLGSFFYFIDASGLNCTFTPFHSSYGNRAILYDGTARDSGVVLSTAKFSTVLIRFLPGQTDFFIDGAKTSTAGRNEINADWYFGKNFDGQGGTAPMVSVLGHIPGYFSDAECIRISDEPYSALFEPALPISFDFPTSGGIVTLNSLTMSNITSSGARATLSIAR